MILIELFPQSNWPLESEFNLPQKNRKPPIQIYICLGGFLSEPFASPTSYPSPDKFRLRWDVSSKIFYKIFILT
jgi:hypothetical protein